MENFWDLHIAYVRECEKLNWSNNIDPHHYEMEWHHILPQCLFGDQPVGAWLTLRQHSIASCLQSIALKKICFFSGLHKHFVPSWLWDLTLDATAKERENIARKGFVAVANLPRLGGIALTKQGKGIHTFSAEEKTQRGLKAVETNRKNGTAVFASGVASLGAAAVHLEKDEEGKSLHAKRGGTLACQAINKQRWEDPDHPELGQHRPNTLVILQKHRGLPHGKENRRRVQ
jgi:hypothetical protein